MSKFFVPYTGDRPAAIDINGHRLLILSRSKESLEDELDSIGADTLKTLQAGSSKEEESKFLNRLARKSGAGVVVAPVDLELKDVIKNLEVQLPWLQ